MHTLLFYIKINFKRVNITIIPSVFQDKVWLQTGAFNFKKLLGFTFFFKDPARLGNRTYRAWGENSIEKWTIE